MGCVSWNKKSKTKLINNNDKNIITISGNIKVLKFSNFKEDKTIIEYVNNDKQFKSNYARLKPFLLSKGRNNLHNLIKNNIDDVVHFHTDGFLIKNNLNIKTGLDIGDLKYEGFYKKVEIHHINKIIGELKKT